MAEISEKTFRSMSTAASAVTGHAMNGRAFWKDATPEETVETTPAVPARTRKPERHLQAVTEAEGTVEPPAPERVAEDPEDVAQAK